MNTLNFPDTNVWMALIHRGHVHSSVARSWFDGAADEQLFFCRFTQIAVLRLLTTAKVMGPDTADMAAAWRLWDEVMADDRIAFLEEPAGLEDSFRSLTKLPSASPKVWGDSYLVAFASAANLKLVTFDRALKLRGGEVLVLEHNSLS